LENHFYEFSIHVNFDKIKGKEFCVVDILNNPIFLLDTNPYKEIVRKRYERLNHPEANKLIANLMLEIGKGLYSSKQRMIFELLQNADDTPAGEEVKFHIDAYGDYLLIMHNGLPFSKDDVEAITSAAESTKRNEKKKTGYKGIGFKSVFTDSEEVIIKSGGFLFAFQKNYPGFEFFDSFYFDNIRYKENPKYLEEDKEKFSKQRESYNNLTDIPWQLIPIWLDEIPTALAESAIEQYNNNVGIALKFGRERIHEYLEAINIFASKPHFLLFLRNISLFKSLKNDNLKVSKSNENPVTIEKTNDSEENISITYYKKEIDIIVSDEELHHEGVLIYRKSRKNEFDGVTYYFSTDEKGLSEMVEIPPKLAAFDSITITFAAPIINDQIQAEDKHTASSFFTYLPMKEQRMHLPFLVNADFVPDSSREKLQGDNKWNEFLIAKIAKNHVLWLSEIAEYCSEHNVIEPKYLSLLLDNPIEEEESMSLLISKYNSVYLNTIAETAFILSAENNVLRADEIIIDKTDISKILGNDLFYKLSATDKKLPRRGLNITNLDSSYLNIETFRFKNIETNLATEEQISTFKNAVESLSDSAYMKFLLWLDDIVQINDVDKEWLKKLPLIKFQNQVLSIEDALKKENLIIRTNQIDSVSDILIKLNFLLSPVPLDKFTHIWDKLDVYNSGKGIFEQIASSNSFGKLNATEKSRLIVFFEGLEKVGETKYAQQLALFKGKSGRSLKPLSRLISNSIIVPAWLVPLQISLEEETALGTAFKKYLISEKLLSKVFCDATLFEEIIANVTESQLTEFYEYALNLFKVNNEKTEGKESTAGLSDLPWAFSSSAQKFVKSDVLYFPDSLSKLSQDKYKKVSEAIKAATENVTPDFRSVSLLKALALGTKRIELLNSIKIGEIISKDSINEFLDWLEDSKEKAFFDKFYLIPVENGYKICSSVYTAENSDVVGKKIQYFSNNPKLIEYIKKVDKTSDFVLADSYFYTENRNEIGLYDNDKLYQKLIELGLTDLSFVDFFDKTVSDETKLNYLMGLREFKISTKVVYDNSSSEYKLMKLACDVLTGTIETSEKSEIINGLNKFRSIIVVDDHLFTSRDKSDDIYFPDPIKVELLIKRSDVLPETTEEAFSVSAILNSFESLPNKQLIKIFELRKEHPNLIFEKLIKKGTIELNPRQAFFLVIYLIFNPQKLNDAKGLGLKFLTNENNLKDFINIYFEHKSIVQTNAIYGFNSKSIILDKDFAIKSEVTPSWLIEWMAEGEKNEEKIAYLEQLGVNSEKSAVAKFRKAILEKDLNQININRELITEVQLLKNTLVWLSEKNIPLNKDLLKPIYTKLELLKADIEALLLPVLKEIGVDEYKLVQLKEGETIYVMLDSWAEHKHTIFEFLVKGGGKVTDNVLPLKYITDFKALQLTPAEIIQKEEIIKNSELFNEEYYKNWRKKEEHKIFIYKGKEIPVSLNLGILEVIKINGNYAKKIDNKFYIAESKKDNFFRYLEGLMEVDVLESLELAKNKWNNNPPSEEPPTDTPQGPKFTTEEIETWKKLFGNEIPETFYKDINLGACVTALNVLDKKGFDVSRVDLKECTQYAQLEPIFDTSGLGYTYMCRSAKQGLLYLTANAWNRLDDGSISLFAKTGNKPEDYMIFDNKQSILDECKTEFQIMRFKTGLNSEGIDLLLTGDYPDMKEIWLLFLINNNEKYSSIFGKINGQEENPDYDNFG
jgi:hypothetical protein